MIRTAIVVVLALLAVSAPARAQSPARDCEIRAAYSDMTDATDIWLTLEPRTPDGKPGPPGTVVTLTARFAGKRPARPATEVEVRANVGMLWAPRAELWLLLDGEDRIDLDAKTPVLGMNANSGIDFVTATMSTRTLEQIANARRVTGSVLGLQVEFTDAQREALRRFLERVTSRNPS